jgi:hypothetical protein
MNRCLLLAGYENNRPSHKVIKVNFSREGYSIRTYNQKQGLAEFFDLGPAVQGINAIVNMYDPANPETNNLIKKITDITSAKIMEKPHSMTVSTPLSTEWGELWDGRGSFEVNLDDDRAVSYFLESELGREKFGEDL